MENYNQSYDQNQAPNKGLFNALEVDANGKLNLAEAGKWAKFLGILSIIMLAMMVFGALAVVVMGASIFEASPDMQALPFSPSLIGALYLVIALINVYPTWALFKFGTLIRTAVRTENQAMFNEGTAYLKGFFKFFGIFAIIIIAIYIIVIIAAVVGAGIGSMQ